MGVWHGIRGGHQASTGRMLGRVAWIIDRQAGAWVIDRHSVWHGLRGGRASAVDRQDAWAYAPEVAGHQPLTGRMLGCMAWANRQAGALAIGRHNAWAYGMG